MHLPAPRFRGDYQQLSKIATSFATQAGDCQRTLQQVKDRMATLQGGDWIGQGAQAFYREMEQELLPSLQRLVIAIGQAERVTLQISRIVKEAEEAASRLLSGEGVGAAALGSLAPAVQATWATATPITTPTPTPSPPPPTATPVPPGWTPTPSSTPTFEEMQSTSAQQHQQWLDSLRSEVTACAESGDPEGCQAAVGATIYAHYGWDLFKLAASGLDNPLPDDSDEVRIMGHQVVGNLTDPVVGPFIRELHLNLDHYSNFEPAFVEALKGVNRDIYEAAVRNVQEHGWDMAIAEEVLAKMVNWTAGPILGQFFVSSE